MRPWPAAPQPDQRARDPRPDGTPPAAEGSDPVEVIRQAGARGLTLATAESLTAGAVVARLVDVPGASAVIAGGAACYSLEAKTRVLGVDAALLAATGESPRRSAAAMAEGARSLYGTDLAVSTTGVAGPGPDERGIALRAPSCSLSPAGTAAPHP